MNRAEAEAEAPRWMGYTRSLARRPPPTYSLEDWQAEALYALARALRDFEPRPGRAPMARFVPYLQKVVRHHLGDCWAAVRRSPGKVGAPRLAYAEALSLDAPTNDVEHGTLHDIIADPWAVDPAESVPATLDGRAAFDEIVAMLARAMPSWTPEQRQALGHLLDGLTPAQVAARLGISHTAAANRRLHVRRKVAAVLEARQGVADTDPRPAYPGLTGRSQKAARVQGGPIAPLAVCP